MTLKTLITVVLGAGALTVGAQSALAVPPDLSGNPNSSQGEPQQIVVRGQGPTTSYGIGNVMTQEEKALLARSQGLNELYGLGDNVPFRYETYGQPTPAEIVRDHGDATQAKLVSSSSVEIVRDHGDATQAKLDAQSTAVASRPELDSSWSFDWPQVGIGIGVGMLLLFGLFLTVRHTRNPVAH